MLAITTDTEGFMDIACTGANGCGREYNGVGPLWGADIIAVHADSHGPANGNDNQRLSSKLYGINKIRQAREAAAAAAHEEAHRKFWANRPGH